MPRRPERAAPAWAVRSMAVSGAVLLLAAVTWLASMVLLALPMLTLAVALAVLLTAGTAPLAGALRRRGTPRALAALAALLVPFLLVIGIGLLVGFRAAEALRDLTGPVAAGIDRIRAWLIDGPLDLDAQQVAEMRDEAIVWLYAVVPSPAAGARMVLTILGALVLVAFLVFFQLKDGRRMWAWFLARVPDRRREQFDGAGRTAWTTLGAYVRGVLLVALIDAVGIGLALVVLDVPLWPSLTLLTFIGAFIPLLGATLTGAVAVLVTLVTNGLSDAVVVLVVVLVVQQLEGNVLQPLIMGRALRLHPVAILVVVTAGTLAFGLPGALLAVPALAVTYRVAEHLRTHPARRSALRPAGVGAIPSRTAPVTGP